MQITDLLEREGGLESLARELGISQREAATGAEALAPAVLGGFTRKVETEPDAGDGLASLLDNLGGGGLIDNVVSREPTDLNRGNSVLGSIFGSKDVSRAVAQDASAKTGLQPSLLKKMLPMLAMMVGGYLAKRRRQQGAGTGGLGGILGNLLGNGGSAGGLSSMFGGGNPLDAILNGARQRA